MTLADDIETSLSSNERYRNGIFFTSEDVVNDIIDEFDWDKIESVIDTASGSCNFLISLANKYPNKTFYGVEKNKKIISAMEPIVEKYNNLTLFHGDILLDKFDIPKCDLYLGNPPFINFSDLDDDYRVKLIPMWKEYFNVDNGFKMMLGQSRGDISQLIFYFSIKNYIKENGCFGVVLPDSLLFGNSASSGFREFNDICIEKIVDLSHRDPFLFTSRNCFYITGRNGDVTKFPIPFYKDKDEVNLYKNGSKLVTKQSNSVKYNTYISRQGINTLGANSIFFFKKDPPFQSKLLKPLLKSSDVFKWHSNSSYHVLFPYDSSGQLLKEEDLKKVCKTAYHYLQKNKKRLLARKSKLPRGNWYSLFGVGSYTVAKYKVVWRALGATQFEAAVVIDSIPNQAMHGYIGFDNEAEAHFVCSVMNSNYYSNEVENLSQAGSKSFALPSIINQIFIPKYNPDNHLHNELSEISKSFHLSKVVDEVKWNKNVEDLLKKV